MNQELLLQLHKADFPFKPLAVSAGGSKRIEQLYSPSLSELIVACGNDLTLIITPEISYAGAVKGKTPLIAVANLYLKLHENHAIQKKQ